MKYLESLARSLPANIVGPGLISLIIKVIGAVVTYVMIVALARLMSIEEYGRFAFGLNLSIIVAALGGLGFQTGILRYWPKFVATGDVAGARGVVRLGFRYSTTGGLIIILVSVVGGLITWIITGQFRVFEFMTIAVLGLAISLCDYCTSLLRAQGSTLGSMLPREVLWRTGTIVCCALLFLAGYAITGLLALMVCAAVLLCLMLWQAGQIRSNIRLQLPPSEARGNFADFRSSLLPFWATGIVIAMLQQFDVVVVGSLLGNAQAGSYFAAQKTASLLSLVQIAAGLVAAPSMSSLYHTGKIAELQRLCRNLAGGIATVTAIGVIMLALVGKFLLGLFDEKFVAAYPILMIVAMGSMIDGIAGPNAFLMQMTNYEKSYLKITSICYALVLAAQFILVPRLGGVGAALASAGGVALWNIWGTFILRRQAGLDPSLLSLIWPPRAAAAQ